MLSNEKWFGATSADFYTTKIDQSLRYNYGDSPYLARTSDSGNRRTFTFSAWFKRSSFNNTNSIFGATLNGSNFFALRFRDTDDTDGGKLQIANYSGSFDLDLRTSQVFRDSTNWYHIVVAVDTTQSTSSDRVKLYVNGSQVTSFSTETYPSQNFETRVSNGHSETVGAEATTYSYIDGYLAEVNFIDGTALTPSSFGETKNGVWIPKAISGLTYGTNGFRLTFADSSNLGDDTSGNGNDYTSSGLASTDVVLDSPTNNFMTLAGSLARGNSNIASSEGNLKFIKSGANFSNMLGSFAVFGGKWYCEAYISTSNLTQVGIQEATNDIYQNGGDYGPNTDLGMWDSRGYYYDEGTAGGSAPTYGTGDIINIAFDVDAGKIWFGKNNTYNHSGDPANGTNQTTGSTNDLSSIGVTIAGNGENGGTAVYNCGQDSSFAGAKTAQGNTDANGIGDFYYSPPSGFLALCSSNLPDTTISPNQDTQADDHFNTVLYTGDASSPRNITGVGFQPDWSWFAQRNNSSAKLMYDSSRGVNKNLRTDSTNAEDNNSIYGYLSAFGVDGFTLTAGTTNNNYLNENNINIVSWNWKSGGTTPSKTYKVVVVSDSGNKYRFRNSSDSATFGSSAVTLDLQEGGTYTFDWSDSTAQGHPIRFSTTSDGTHGGGSEYTTGVVKDDSGYKTTITVADGVATLYYYCQNHSGMGGQINTNTTHGSTNFDGSILSVSQTNETSGFSIATYTGTGSLATVGHGLGSTAQWVIIKKRSASGNWVIGHHQNGFNGQLYFDSGAFSSNSGSFNNTAPTSTVVTINTDSTINTSSATYVMYCFTEIEGYSKFGSYTGNGSSDGTFVFTGFRPAWILIKSSSHGEPWNLVDIKRDTFNVMGNYLQPHSSGAEATIAFVDGLSNGFKLRSSGSGFNGSGYTFIYICFAEQPFKFSNSR